LQNSMLRILLLFRLNPFAISADVSKMFLSVGMAEQDQKWYKIHIDGNDYQFNNWQFESAAGSFAALVTIWSNGWTILTVWRLVVELPPTLETFKTTTTASVDQDIVKIGQLIADEIGPTTQGRKLLEAYEADEIERQVQREAIQSSALAQFREEEKLSDSD
jgi:hypothetical protein